MPDRSLILVVNPGSASRKYSLFHNDTKLVDINFEFENGKVVASLIQSDQKTHIDFNEETNLDSVASYILSLASDYEVIDNLDKVMAIGVRLVAPSQRFMKDEIVTDETIQALEAIQKSAPLHVTTVLSEIKQLRNSFPSTPIVIISDSAFHATKPDKAIYYGLDKALADKADIKRFGYHGISASSVVRVLTDKNLLKPKTILCHIGSGSSVMAILDGKSVETSMGYTPLEGLVMSTRVGNIDPAAVMAIKRELRLNDDEVESYLNKKCGLLGISGTSNDIRQLLTQEADGDEMAKLALEIFIYRIQLAIGQMAASLKGVDQIVFTATVGERSQPIRSRIVEGLDYLGLVVDKSKNDDTFEPKQPVNISTSASKPIIVISTDESSEIARRAAQFGI